MSGEERAPGLEERLRRLESIVDTLERDELELEEAMALFEEGIAHVRGAEELLSRTELRVERLVADAQGGETREPVERT